MRKVMIVDDNHLSAEGVEKNINWDALEARVVHICYNGEAAIQAFQQEPVDLIITDIEMPDMDGLTMGKAVLAINPMVKIILISAYDKFEYARSALRIGALDYIEKPLDFQYLTQKVKNAFTALEREEKNISLLKKSRPLLIEKFFRELTHLPPNEARPNLQSHMEYLQLQLDYSFYNVIAIEPENIQEYKEQYGIEKYQIELLNIRDIILEHTSIFSYAYLLDNFDGYLCVLGQDGSHANHFLQVCHKVMSSIVEAAQITGLSLNIGIGTIVTDFWNLSRSCAAAKHALEYRFFFPHKNVFDGREALGRDLSVAEFSTQKEEELIRLLCKKDESAIDLWIEDFSQGLTRNFQTKNFAFIQIYSLLGRILKFFYELSLDTNDLEKKIIHVYNHIEQFHTSEDLCTWLKNLCHLACSKLNTSMNDYHQKLCESVISYIEDNYMSNALCLNDIAREANVSPAYLSALFKKTQEISISDLITSRRIDAACRYLTATNLSLKEISIKCGYTNQYYFSTSFKKRMGITPTAYRESH